MKQPDSNHGERAFRAIDVVVSADDCANAYLEFSSEATLPSSVTRAERRESDSEFLSEHDPDFLDRVDAQIIADDDWGLTSEGDAGEVVASIISASSSSVTHAEPGSNTPRPMRVTARIILAVAVVVAFATGALAVRIVVGSPITRTASRVGSELPRAPQPPAFVHEAQVEPAVPGAAPELPGHALDVDAEAP